MNPYEVDACIVGGGPAGMLLGLMLAHQRLKVLVLEQHKDFEREYRGEVLMPRFTQMLRQIRLFDFLESYPHLKLQQIEIFYRNLKITDIRFSDLVPDAPFAIWMPQPILLNALYDKAKQYPNFGLWFDASVQDLLEENGRVIGVSIRHKNEPRDIRAKVTVGCDGRSSIVRRRGHFELDLDEHDFDVIWFTIPKPLGYDNTVRAFLSPRKSYLILPKYPEHIQCGLVIPKGEFVRYKKKGISSLQRDLLSAHSVMHDFAKGLQDFSPFNVLQAVAQHVKDWARDGCLLVGDAAHTCSPAGAIGVSVAVGTAIVAADVISEAFREKDFSHAKLQKVQNLRDPEVRRIQKIQKQFSRLLFNQSPLMKRLAPALLLFISKTGLLRKFQKKIAVLPDPLAVSTDLYFNDKK